MQASTLNASRTISVAPSARVSRPIVRVSRSSGAAAARVAARRVATRAAAVEAVETVSVATNGNGNGAVATKANAKALIEVCLRSLLHTCYMSYRMYVCMYVCIYGLLGGV